MSKAKSNGKGKAFNKTITLNRLKDIPEQKKTHMQMMLENALKKKQGN